MYYIITNEPEDELVMKAVNQLSKNFQSPIPASNGNYQFITSGGKSHIGGNGGTKANRMVIIGHANADGISGYKSYNSYWIDLINGDPRVKLAIDSDTVVYLVACSAAGISKIHFKNLNIAEAFKNGLNVKKLWASTSSVYLNFDGDWEKV